MTLDNAIQLTEMSEQRAFNAGHGYAAAEYREMAEWLKELKHRRETEIRPATRFLNNSMMTQFEHIKSEVKEVEDELEPYYTDIDKLAEELVDLQMSCETMLAIIGYDDQGRAEIRRKVIAKNMSRGYYEEAKP